MKSYDILGIRVDDVSLPETEQLFRTWLMSDTLRIVVTPNPEMIVLAQRDQAFRAHLNAADLALPDGIGLKLAAPLRHRITGVEALLILRRICSEQGKRLVTVGSADAMIDAGVVDRELAANIVERVTAMQPDVIAIGLGQGKQEEVIERHAASWPTARIIIGVGGAIDMLSGRQWRAPRLIRAIGLEWLWRLLTQPWRLRRILNAVIVFPFLILRQKFL